MGVRRADENSRGLAFEPQIIGKRRSANQEGTVFSVDA